MNTNDCSQGFCSLYCPQWCYIIFPPPPPIQFRPDDSSPIFTPLLVTTIVILACVFLLVSYYTIISNYCGKNVNSARRRENHESSGEVLDDNHDPSTHEPWQASTTGLDEALIDSITVCKYRKGDGLVDGIDCSVCLGEFREDESLRLLPKCSHAFHVHCIDTWLRSHSNCPLCRANIELLHDENVAAANDTVIEIREEGQHQRVRRSVSMDHLCETRVSVADILLMNQEEECHFSSGTAGSSKQCTEASKPSNKIRVLPCAMKRSFSSGRFFLARQAIPL